MAAKKTVKVNAVKKSAKVDKKSSAGVRKGNKAGVREGSKTELLVKAVSSKGGATLDEICAASGFDKQNARTTIGVLRSKGRGGEKMNIVLNRETGKYALA